MASAPSARAAFLGLLLCALAGEGAVNVTVLGQVPVSPYALSLFVHDQLVFVVRYDQPSAQAFLDIYDVSDPGGALQLSSTPLAEGCGDMHGVYYSNGLVYVALSSGFAVFDLQDPSAPVEL